MELQYIADAAIIFHLGPQYFFNLGANVELQRLLLKCAMRDGLQVLHCVMYFLNRRPAALT